MYETERIKNNNNNKLSRLLTVNEVAEILGLGKSTVYLHVNKQDLKSIRFGRSIRICLEDLDNFIEEHKV